MELLPIAECMKHVENLTKQELLLEYFRSKGLNPVESHTHKYVVIKIHDKLFYFLGSHGAVRKCDRNAASKSWSIKFDWDKVKAAVQSAREAQKNVGDKSSSN